MSQLILNVAQLKHLQLGPDGVMSAETADPQIYLAPSDGRFTQLEVDKAVFRAKLERVGDAALVNPCLYLDYGEGFSEAREGRLRLRPDAAGVVSVEIASPWRLRSLRLDPSERICRLTLGPATLAPAPGAKPQKPAGGALSLLRRAYRSLPLPLGLKRAAARRLVSTRIQRRLSIARLGGGANHRVAKATAYRAAYEAALATQLGWRSPLFGAPRLTPVDAGRADARVIAFHLPQYHPFPENDRWWGAGFTEWSNVSKAVPQFLGHQQPKLPTDLGFYDLRNVESLAAQAELARRHGVSGFCFHFYWFGGRRLMEQPLLNWLGSGIDFPFALCWANENWTRRWDGAEDELLIGQDHSAADDLAFIDYVSRYLRDPRYIRVQGKPMLVVYRPLLLTDPKATATRWRARALELGLPGLHLVAANAFGFEDAASIGFDALVEFPPHGVHARDTVDEHTLLNPDFEGAIYDYAEIVAQAAELESGVPGTVYPGVFPGWDNTARRKGAGNVFFGATPPLFRDWLGVAADRAAALPADQRMIFVNAWNEWAEGAYLEPDRLYGHAPLCAVADLIEQRTPPDAGATALAARQLESFACRRETLAIVHVFYPELAGEIAALIRRLGPVDLLITLPQSATQATLEAVLADLPDAGVVLTPNRGRDVLPFLIALQTALALPGAGWARGLKLHTKRSAHLASGDAWRASLYEGLLHADPLPSAGTGPRVGLSAPSGALRPLTGDAMVNNIGRVEALARRMGGVLIPQDRFPAGSMFWFRPAAMRPLLNLSLTAADFEPELGQIDGSTAHAIERLFGVASRLAGFTVSDL